ncbi:response regulator transcription factor [Pseudacidovorax sp. RU35E]|uniref:response regulator n=1 Tax=Pseudacidovorax sp. RU35E TaxID=1907403 RepID=UPI0009F89A82|nr:response regulator transcription factor [Pseudacidovorax sp. RU35E]
MSPKKATCSTEIAAHFRPAGFYRAIEGADPDFVGVEKKFRGESAFPGACVFRLLICDDHPPIRTALRLLARQVDATSDVTETGNARDLVEVLRGRRDFDLLVLDLQLPGMSGLNVLSEVKQLRPELAVLVLSADESPQSVDAALQAGASSYLFKSASETVLFQALKDVCGRRLALPESITAKAGGRGRTVPDDGLALSARQRDVLNCLLHGMSAKQVARTLGLSEGTVKSHTVAVFRALNVSSRAQAVVEAHRRGITLGC